MWTFQRKKGNAPICHCVHLILILFYFMSLEWRQLVYGITSAQINSSSKKNDGDITDQSRITSRTCRCMEYWECATKHGQPYSYCGISDTEVCCFIEDTETKKQNRGPKTLLTPLTSLTTTTTLPPPLPPPLPHFMNFSRSSRVKSQNRRRPNPAARNRPAEPRPPMDCGKQRSEGNLDNVAQFMEWPWHVAILESVDDIYICGGSLISPNRVLTAAHCVASYTAKGSKTRLKIRAGEYDVSANSEALPHVEVLVNMVAVHPKFNNATLENDIGIIGLSRDIKFADNIQPVCLMANEATQTSQPNLQGEKGNPIESSGVKKIRRCVVTGWGRRNEETPHSVVLKEIVVPVWESVDCETRLKSTFGPQFKLPATSICAGDLKRDACDGDGGGPLVCWSKGKWVQEGIVSYGIGCGRRESPGIYTKISSFINWIDAFLYGGVVNSDS